MLIAIVGYLSRSQGISYSQFMAGLRESNMEVNRKMLAEMAVKDPEGFVKLVAFVSSKNANAGTA